MSDQKSLKSLAGNNKQIAELRLAAMFGDLSPADQTDLLEALERAVRRFREGSWNHIKSAAFCGREELGQEER